MTKRCDDCLFAAQRFEFADGVEHEWWECRYHPPMPTFPNKVGTFSRHWRRVTADFWCSKHESRKLQEELKEMYQPTPVSPF